MTSKGSTVNVPMECLRVGCATPGMMTVHLSSPPDPHSFGITPMGGWIFYASRFPSARSLGVCPEHHEVTDPEDDSRTVRVSDERHGVYFEVFKGGIPVGKFTFPSNTLKSQVGPGTQVNERIERAARRVEAIFGFLPEGGRA